MNNRGNLKKITTMSKTKRSSVVVDEVSNEDFLDLPHEDFAAYCRLCFSISQLEPLFVSRQDVNYQLIGVIEMCTGIKLSAKTDTPSSICLQCRLTTDDFLNFRKLCQRLNRVYRRKRNDMALAKISVALEYHQRIDAVPSPVVAEGAIDTETSPVAEDITVEPSPMDVVDETCATEIAAEPSAMEASADPMVGDESAPASFIVHELSDDDDDVECTGISSVETIPIDLGAADKESDPFIKMANDWYCCKICSRLYQSFPLLAGHFREIHPNKAPLLRTKQQESYFIPKDSDVQMLKIGVKTYFKCDLCDTLFAQKRNISRHRWRYHGTFDDSKKTFCTMPDCRHFFMERKALSRHMGIVHGYEIEAKAHAATSPADGVDDDVVVITDCVEDEAGPALMQVIYTDQ
ncbi:uncharacterized protein LOC135699613 [Ochlerotatus camptorhynchus]|uniref:uncharacterized protein LOC135699613 n=1 Tax=Ochlerotatus camptorhynchus TaxID=644619 RepID=UPI0031E11173